MILYQGAWRYLNRMQYQICNLQLFVSNNSIFQIIFNFYIHFKAREGTVILQIFSDNLPLLLQNISMIHSAYFQCLLNKSLLLTIAHNLIYSYYQYLHLTGLRPPGPYEATEIILKHTMKVIFIYFHKSEYQRLYIKAEKR